MVYDPAWNMPNRFWGPHSSYPASVVPPTGDPDGGTLVCLPPINRDWLPYIQGCLDQLTLPTTWQVANDDAMYDILSRVNRLKEMVGLSEACVSYQQRFTAECGLEYSIDGGETWIAVAGWLENFAHCFPPQTELRLNSNCNLQESFDGGATWPNVPGWASNFRGCARDALPPPTPEPYPPTLPPADQACNIATYLAQKVIRGAMQQANDSIAATESLLTFGVALLALIPGIDLVAAGVLGGGAALFRYIEDGRTAAFTTAAADDSYWQRMACNIQTCIAATGYITEDNWPCVLAAIPATTYSNSDVQFAVGQYAAQLGYYGAAITQQVGNLELGSVCDCGSGPWCTQWGPGYMDLCNGNWQPFLYGSTAPCTCSGDAFRATNIGTGGGFFTAVRATLPFVRDIQQVRVDYDAGHDDVLFTAFYNASNTLIATVGLRNWNSGGLAGIIHGVKYIEIVHGAGDGMFDLTRITVGGREGGSPWGVNNGDCGPGLI